jgi:hypothetical protein
MIAPVRDATEELRLIEVWVAMADHFLDTETRHDIPLTALRCVQAELSTGEARDIWRHEVAAVVGFNLLSITGEWAGWDRAWLVDAIRTKRDHRRGAVKRFVDAVAARSVRGVLTSIERCMAFLSGAAVEDRERLARELATLARHAFDVGPANLAILEPEAHARLASLYPEPFTSLIAPALLPDEAAGASQRVAAALQRAVKP